MHNPYVSTFLGNRFFLTNPHIDDVAIEDIAHGLAYQCRFNGQTRAFYSVAQHSLMVMSLVPEEMPHSVETWTYLHATEPLPATIQAMTPQEAKIAFLDAFNACIQTHKPCN